MEDPYEILLPRGDLSLITLGENESMHRAPFSLLDDLPLDIGQSSAIENLHKWITLRVHYRFGSLSQSSNRIQDGLVELIQSLPLQFLV